MSPHAPKSSLSRYRIKAPSKDVLTKRTVGIFGRDLVKRDRLDLRALAFAAEFEVALLAECHRGSARSLEVGARIEAGGIFDEVAANSSRHRKSDVGVDVHLAYAVLDRLLDFFDGYAVRFAHLTAEFADFSKIFLFGRRAWISLTRSIERISPVGRRVNL